MPNPKFRSADYDHNDEEDYYDDEGHSTPSGIYDVGGHLILERYVEMADYLYDRESELLETR